MVVTPQCSPCLPLSFYNTPHSSFAAKLLISASNVFSPETYLPSRVFVSKIRFFFLFFFLGQKFGWCKIGQRVGLWKWTHVKGKLLYWYYCWSHVHLSTHTQPSQLSFFPLFLDAFFTL